jgi:Ethanolamine utilization protein EutJ (predicted chaperonin)
MNVISKHAVRKRTGLSVEYRTAIRILRRHREAAKPQEYGERASTLLGSVRPCVRLDFPLK